ncbi:hypothetical protein M9458_043797, partial [Cirrhinus mrigala]
MCFIVPLQELELRPKTLWKRLWRNHALNTCNLANRRTIRHGRMTSSTRKHKSTFCLSAEQSMCVLSPSFFVQVLASPQSVQYEELLEVVTRAVAKLNIDWPAEEKAAPQKSKRDERFLRSKPPSPRRSLPFFPDLHKEILRSWARPYSARLFVPTSDYYGNMAGLDERAYKAMPRVEQTLASSLSPCAASSLKAPTLSSKPLRTTSAHVGKGYSAAGQAGACLHTMSLLQAYQADLLQGLAEGDKVDLEELRRTADLALGAKLTNIG